jgi:hypothetical protein
LRLFIAEPYELVPAVRAGDRTGSAIWAPLMDAGELRLTFGRDD